MRKSWRAFFGTTAGNFRLLHRLLTQIARVLEINTMTTVTCQVVETAPRQFGDWFRRNGRRAT